MNITCLSFDLPAVFSSTTILEAFHGQAIALTPRIAWFAETRVTDLAPQYQTADVANGYPVMPIVAVVASFVVFGLLVVSRRGQRVVGPASDPLTMKLCEGFGLTVNDRLTLDWLARLASCELTAELFLSVEHFDRLCVQAAKKKRFRYSQKVKLGELRRTLFDEELAI